MHRPIRIQAKSGQSAAELLTILPIFMARFWEGAILSGLVLTVDWAKL